MNRQHCPHCGAFVQEVLKDVAVVTYANGKIGCAQYSGHECRRCGYRSEMRTLMLKYLRELESQGKARLVAGASDIIPAKMPS